MELPSKLPQLVTYVICIRKVPSLISGRDTGCPEVFFMVFLGPTVQTAGSKAQALHTDALGGGGTFSVKALP
jgi:hypothetical protein